MSCGLKSGWLMSGGLKSYNQSTLSPCHNRGRVLESIFSYQFIIVNTSIWSPHNLCVSSVVSPHSFFRSLYLRLFSPRIIPQACAQMRAGAFKCKCKCKRRIKCKCKLCKCTTSESNASVLRFAAAESNANAFGSNANAFRSNANVILQLCFSRSSSDNFLNYLITTIN